MRQNAVIRCYKISPRLDLKQLTNIFTAPIDRGNESLTLSGEEIRRNLGYTSGFKTIWFYKYGCICLLGSEEPEVSGIFKILETSGIQIDYQLVVKYQDRHQLEWDSDFSGEATESAAAIAAVLAKSTELWKLEDTVDHLVDESEKLIIDLQRGSFGLSDKLLQQLNLDLIRLQYDLIQNLKVLDRPLECNCQLDLRELYDQTASGYEIPDRFRIVQQKMADLLTIITPYEDQGYSRKERRVAILETVLIALFPVSYLIQMIIHLH